MSRGDAYIHVMCDKCEYMEEMELTAIACNGWDERDVTKRLEKRGWFCAEGQDICEECHDAEQVHLKNG